MNVEIFIQARMGSTRLPGKVLMSAAGKTLLEHLLERLKRSKQANACIVLTSHSPLDDPIVELCKELNVAFYRGPEEDVLGRYYGAAKKRRPDAIVRITGDCPLIDPEIVDRLIAVYRKEHVQWDLVSNVIERSYPRGQDVEIFSFAALERAHSESVDAAEREHVSLYFYRHPEKFRLKGIIQENNMSGRRITVDTIEDYHLIQMIFEEFYAKDPDFRLDDIIDFLKRHPELGVEKN